MSEVYQFSEKVFRYPSEPSEHKCKLYDFEETCECWNSILPRCCNYWAYVIGIVARFRRPVESQPKDDLKSDY